MHIVTSELHADGDLIGQFDGIKVFSNCPVALSDWALQQIEKVKIETVSKNGKRLSMKNAFTVTQE